MVRPSFFGRGIQKIGLAQAPWAGGKKKRGPKGRKDEEFLCRFPDETWMDGIGGK